MNTSVLYRRYIILGKIINLCIYIFLGFGWPGVVFVFVFVVGLGIWRESVGDFFFSGKYSCLLASNLGFALRLKLGVEAEVTSVGDGTCSTRFFAAPLATCLARTPNPRACRVSLWQWAPGETVTTKSILASPPIWINTNTKYVIMVIPRASCNMWVSREFLYGMWLLPSAKAPNTSPSAERLLWKSYYFIYFKEDCNTY